MKYVFLYGSAIFLIGYGLRSMIAGFRNESKSYFITTRYDGFKGLKNYTKYENITLGFVSLFSGITIFFLY